MDPLPFEEFVSFMGSSDLGLCVAFQLVIVGRMYSLLVTSNYCPKKSKLLSWKIVRHELTNPEIGAEHKLVQGDALFRGGGEWPLSGGRILLWNEGTNGIHVPFWLKGILCPPSPPSVVIVSCWSSYGALASLDRFGTRGFHSYDESLLCYCTAVTTPGGLAHALKGSEHAKANT